MNTKLEQAKQLAVIVRQAKRVMPIESQMMLLLLDVLDDMNRQMEDLVNTATNPPKKH